MPKGSSDLRYLNQPQPLTVSADANHRPTAVNVERSRKAVTQIADVWIVQEGWWREGEIDRQYFKIVLDDGRIMTIFRDRIADAWFEQDYTHPEELGLDIFTERE